MGKNRTRQKTLFFVGISFVAVLFVVCAASEVLLRAAGIKPWNTTKVAIRVEPGGRLFTPHPTLGYTHIPGAFRVTLPDGYSFKVTHLPNTLRVTHPLKTYPAALGRDELWIFGCSFTHGWALNDEETYPWLLQAQLPEYEVVNFGVSGYGTLHSLIQFREALETKRPKIAVLTYAGFHDVRNTFVRKRQKDVAPWNTLGPLVQPYASLDDAGHLHYAMAKVEYREFPFMRRSALAHFVEMTYDDFEFRHAHSRRVTEALIGEFATLARANGVRFIVALITHSPKMMEYTRGQGIPTVDISVDLGLPENNNRPHDDHPSALANRRYASKLEAFLRSEVALGAKP